jgi:hypothetical protein
MSKIVAVPDRLYDKVVEVAAKDQVSAGFREALTEIPDVEPGESDRL